MGIFTRNRTATPGVWQPDAASLQVWPATVVDDDGCATEQVHGLKFTLASVPPASVTAWFYATHGPAGTYCAGWCWRYEFDPGPGAPPWTLTGWAGHPRLYPELAGAERAAYDLAVAAASTPRDAGSSDPFGFLDWDGVPW